MGRGKEIHGNAEAQHSIMLSVHNSCVYELSRCHPYLLSHLFSTWFGMGVSSLVLGGISLVYGLVTGQALAAGSEQCFKYLTISVGHTKGLIDLK